jgi:type I restriction enzyme M protein
MAKKRLATEVDSYIYIKQQLKEKGWDTRNPEGFQGGQVYTQNECLSNSEMKRWLILERPENIVKVSERILWVIEAKRSHSQLELALSEAMDYAKTLNQSDHFQVRFVSGVAGNDKDSYLIKTSYLNESDFAPVMINGIESTALLSPSEMAYILEHNNSNIENAKIDVKLFLSHAEKINDILHLGAVNPHQRAGVMAALLLSTLSSTSPNIEETPTVLISEINARVKSVLTQQRKPEFVNDVTIPLPATTDNHIKLKKALVDSLQELNALNIRSAMRSGDDWLGAFYEVFLKYASWAQDLGIVLTPRHVTQFIAEIMDIQHNDIVYDPTCGTGGFLVAAFDYVKRKANHEQLNRFKQYSVFGIEQDSGVASLAVVNMIFRGDGKNNIYEGNCFAKVLEQQVIDGVTTARYESTSPDKLLSPTKPPITKVMMNPPFSLKNSDEKEFKFIDHALAQMQDGGLLFCVLPYPAMVKPGVYKTWRQEVLLKKHTLLAVMTFPIDLFYPVGVTTVGIFIKKGTPHPHNQNVLWIRTANDGLLKSKGKRLPHGGISNDFEKVKPTLKAFLRDPDYPVQTTPQFQQAIPIDFSDALLELVPENYLTQDFPTLDEIQELMSKVVRDSMAYLVQSGGQK